MNRTLKWLTAAVLTPVAIVTAAAALVAGLDWNRLRPMLGERASAALGRPVAIDGTLTVRWARDPTQPGWRRLLPGLQINASQLRIGNPAWAADPLMAQFGELGFHLDLLPLLRRQLSISQLTVSRPEAWLERHADGRNTWTLDQDDEPAAQRWTLDIGEFAFDRGHVRLRDAPNALTLDATVTPLTATIAFDEGLTPDAGTPAAGTAFPAYAFGWQASGSLRGQTFTGEGRVGGLLALRSGGPPFPLQAELRAGRSRMTLAGTLTDPRRLAALDLRLALSGANIADLHALTGLPLPDTPAFATRGRLAARLHEPGGARFDYQDFEGRIGSSDVGGSLSYVAASPRPVLRGQLRSHLLRLADLGPMIGSGTRPAGRILPASPFRTDSWRNMDADLQLSGNRIARADAPSLTDLQTRLQLSDGLLTLAPLKVGMAGGTLTGEARLDGRSPPLQGELRLKARRLDLAQLLPGDKPGGTTLGRLHGEIALAGRGNSVASLLGQADGDIRFILGQGRISRSLMEIAGLNLGNYVIGRLFGDDEVKIHCGLADFGVRQGVARSRLAVLDTENARVDVSGSADFSRERLDLDIRPNSRGLRLLSLRSPLYVQGSFAQPEAGVQTGPLLARGAGAVALGAVVAPAAGLLALLAPGEDAISPCAALLKEIESQRR